MDRGEFLSLLRESLEGYIPREEVEKNISFYRNYFDESAQSDREVIEELGDPRLIARTIIEAYKASKGPMADYYTEQARSEYSRERSETYDDAKQDSNGTFYQYSKEIKWYHKAIFWAVIVLIVSIVIMLAATVVGVFVAYILPVLLLVLVIKILVEYFRR